MPCSVGELQVNQMVVAWSIYEDFKSASKLGKHIEKREPTYIPLCLWFIILYIKVIGDGKYPHWVRVWVLLLNL